jgi:ribosomal protein S18 acetylase RimI-like enzyme
MAVTVREALASEYEALGALTLAAYESLDGMPIGDYADELRDVADRATNAEVMVAVDDAGRLLGCVTYVPGLSKYAEFSDPDAAGIRMLAVDPAARGRGVGEALVRACVARARSAGRARIVLHTTRWMASAQRLYARLGFDRSPDRDWEPEPDMVLLAYELPLGPAGA